MRHIDITIDIETASTAVDAAIMQIAAVAWNREATGEIFIKDIPPFVAHIDLRSCVALGLDFDRDTVKWWSQRPDEVKHTVLCQEAHPLADALEGFNDWLDDLREQTHCATVNAWAHGSDFDMAILRNAYTRCGCRWPFRHRDIRDSRTLILEVGAVAYGIDGHTDNDYVDVYSRLSHYNLAEAHDALYDAVRVSKQVFTVLNELKK